MSYNGSGTFLINTAGQPVVDGTTITATAFNTLTADLATGLTNAICKDGQSTTTARINFAAGAGVSNGTVSSPALNFINDTACGLYRIGSGNIGVAITGSKIIDISASAVAFTEPVGIGTAPNAATVLHLSQTGTGNSDIAYMNTPSLADSSFSAAWIGVNNSTNAKSAALIYILGTSGASYADSLIGLLHRGDSSPNGLFVQKGGSVGIGGLPLTSTILNLDSTTGALMLPRMTSTQRDNLTAVNGMLIYNSTTNKFQGYENGSWTNLI